MNNRTYHVRKVAERVYEMVMGGHPDDGYLSSGGYRTGGAYWTADDAIEAGEAWRNTGNKETGKSIGSGYPMSEAYPE